MESRDVLHNSTNSEELNQTCIDQTTCVKAHAQDIPHDIADQHQDHQRHNHQSQRIGRNLHLAMACINGAERLQRNKKIKANSNQQGFSETKPRHRTKEELSSDLHRVSAEIDTNRAELLELMVQFDEQQGWADSGARNCADWVNAHLGIGQSSAYQFLRVGRELRDLPIIRALFRCGELSWSKVKILTTVADADNEQDLAHVSLTATVTDVERICREFRWAKAYEEGGDPATGRTQADLRAESQFNNRSLTTHEQPDGSIVLRLSLPAEKAQAVLISLEHCQNELYQESTEHVVDNDDEHDDANDNSQNIDGVCSNAIDQPSIRQRRADALVLMAERSLQIAGSDVSRSDRYQVILHVENLNDNQSLLAMSESRIKQKDSKEFPAKRPWIEGAGPIADMAARRISCDASVISMNMQDGEPLNVGRKTRTWPTAIWRAIVTRDRHCQFPGCSVHRHLEVHHIKHWADGGETSVDNGVCLCHRHHVLVHEGGYRIERNTIATNNDSSSKNFGLTIGLVSSDKKALLPTRHRFRFVKAGQYQKECSEHEHEHEHMHQYEHTRQNGHSYDRKNDLCCELPAAYQLKNTYSSSYRPSL